MSLFSTCIRNEVSSYKHKVLEEGSTESSVMKARFEGYFKNGRTEKFYIAYCAQVPLKSITFCPDLSYNAASPPATKFADGILSHCNDLNHPATRAKVGKQLSQRRRIQAFNM